MVTIYENLANRKMDVARRGLVIDPTLNVATFLLYNLSGQIVGYQRYNPNADKTRRNSADGRYFTYTGIESERSRKLALWGIDTIQLNTSVLFVTEGIFDANRIHLAGYSAVAILSNGARAAKSFFNALPFHTIAIMDRDVASLALSRSTTYATSVPAPYHDLDDMPQEEVECFLADTLTKFSIPASYR